MSNRTCPISLRRDGAVRPPDESGTRLSDSGIGLNVVGIPVIHVGEEVKGFCILSLSLSMLFHVPTETRLSTARK